MSIRIVTDSTCDVPESIAHRHNITVIPAYVNIGDKSYIDGIEMSRQQFYTLLPTLSQVPTTSTPGVGMFTELYEKLTQEGADEIISIHLSSTLSAMFNSARLGAEDANEKGMRVTAIDSKQLSLGCGYLVIEAAKMAAQGRTVAEIVTEIESLKERTYVITALDTLEYLRKSGRVSRWESGLGNMLQIKPLITVHQGELGLERTRTRKGAWDRLFAIAQTLGPHDHVAIMHTHASERVTEFQQSVEQLFPNNPIEIVTEVTPIIGTHIGPNAVAVTLVQKQR
jgi:DegV family protein with EDD domain